MSKKSELVKYITIPQTINVDRATLRCGNCGAPVGLAAKADDFVDVSFAEFLATNVLADPWWGAPPAKEGEMDVVEKIALNVAIKRDLKEIDPDDATKNVLALGKRDWETVVRLLRKPSLTYNPTLLAQLYSYVEAVIDAGDADPRVSI